METVADKSVWIHPTVWTGVFCLHKGKKYTSQAWTRLPKKNGLCQFYRPWSAVHQLASDVIIACKHASLPSTSYTNRAFVGIFKTFRVKRSSRRFSWSSGIFTFIHEEIKCGLEAGNSCCYSINFLLDISLKFWKLKYIKQ